jgi:hypothetical protein
MPRPFASTVLLVLLAADTSAAWIGLVGVFAGALISIIGTWILTRSQERSQVKHREHEKSMAEEEVDRARQDAIDTYQVETLLELQIALHRFMRLTFKTVMTYRLHHRSTGEVYGSTFLEPTLNLESMEATSVLRILSSRVRSAGVRNSIDGVIGLGLRYQDASTEAGAVQVEPALQGAAMKAQEFIRLALEELPAPSLYRPIVSSLGVEADRIGLGSPTPGTDATVDEAETPTAE